MSRHKKISFIKSAIRIIGFVIMLQSIPWGVFALVVAELLGIGEEVGEK